jgi:hypothetical protein
MSSSSQMTASVLSSSQTITSVVIQSDRITYLRIAIQGFWVRGHALLFLIHSIFKIQNNRRQRKMTFFYHSGSAHPAKEPTTPGFNNRIFPGNSARKKALRKSNQGDKTINRELIIVHRSRAEFLGNLLT